MKIAKLSKSGLLVIISTLVLLPIAILLYISFTKSWFYPNLLPESWSGEAWKSVGLSAGLLKILVKSLLLSLTVSLVSTSFAFLISKQISAYKKADKLFSLAYLPYAFSPVIYAFCIQFVFIQAGLKGSYSGVFLAQLLITLPFAVLLFAKHWTLQLKNIESLSFSLGASKSQTWFKVILPISRQIIVLSLLQTFLISWFDYGMSWVIGSGVVETLSLRLFQYISESNVAFSAMASLTLIVPPMIILLFQHKIMIRDVA